MPARKVQDVATRESRAKGGKAKAEKVRQRKEQVEREAIEKLGEKADAAIDRLVAALDADGIVVDKEGEVHVYPLHAVRIRAAVALLDRVLGRPSQRHEHSGRLDLDLQLAQAKDDLATRLSRLRERRASTSSS